MIDKGKIIVAAAGLFAALGVAAPDQSGAIRQAIKGESLFRSFCASCHGSDGKGGGPAAGALKTPPPT